MNSADEVDRILDGWFGECLEDAEDEDNRRKHLYAPLRKLVARHRTDSIHHEYRAEYKKLYTDTLTTFVNETSEEGWETVSIQAVDPQFTHSLTTYLIVQRRKMFPTAKAKPVRIA